jgi:hypothetical protein
MRPTPTNRFMKKMSVGYGVGGTNVNYKPTFRVRPLRGSVFRLVYTSALATGIVLCAGCRVPSTTPPVPTAEDINPDTSASIPTHPSDSVDSASIPRVGDTTKAEAGKPSTDVHQGTAKRVLKWYGQYVIVVLSVGLALIGLTLWGAQ